MKLFDRLTAFVEQLPKALENLSAAIHDAAKRERGENKLTSSITAEVRFPREVEDAQAASQNEQIRIQRRIARWAGLAFVAAAIYAAVSCCQLQEMRAQTAQMQRQIRQDQRPWIKIRVDPDQEPSVANGSDVTAGIQLQNVGKTLARDLAVQTRLNVLQSSQAPVLPEGIEAYDKMPGRGWGETSGIRWPEDNPTTDFPVSWFMDDGQKRLATAQDADDWVQARSWVAVYGEADYADIFGVRHWTKFCIWYTGKSIVFADSTTAQSRT